MSTQPALTLTGELTRQLDDAGDLPLLGLTGDELDQLIEADLWLSSRLEAHLAQAIAHAGAIGRPGEVDAPSMIAWLRGRFGISATAAGRLVRDTAGLAGAPAAAFAARVGAVRTESAAEIGHAVTALPDEVGPDLRAAGEDVLIGLAVGRTGPVLDAAQLRYVGRHLHEVLDPDAADRLLADRLDRDDILVHRRRFLSLHDDPDGGVRLRGLFTTEAAATLRAVLASLTAPAAAGTQTVDVQVDLTAVAAGFTPGAPGSTRGTDADSTAGRADGGDSGGDAGASPGLPPLRDDRTGGQRLADALVEAAGRLLVQGELPTGGGERPQLVITLDHHHLLTGLGGGALPDGEDLPIAAVRRLACDADLVPAVLGSAGQVLDLGRTARTATPTQRRAMALRDGGCAFPSCDRPPGWCEAHHIRPWAALGPTDLANLVLLCGHHHRAVHHDGWDITAAADGRRPTFVPPRWIDPDQIPRRNHCHHLRDLLRAPP